MPSEVRRMPLVSSVSAPYQSATFVEVGISSLISMSSAHTVRHRLGVAMRREVRGTLSLSLHTSSKRWGMKACVGGISDNTATCTAMRESSSIRTCLYRRWISSGYGAGAASTRCCSRRRFLHCCNDESGLSNQQFTRKCEVLPSGEGLGEH